jgi:hypothetical protein
MKNLLITLFTLFYFNTFSQKIIKEPKYKISLPQPTNVDSFYCKMTKCFYPLSSKLFIDSLDNDANERSFYISIDFVVTKKGGTFMFQPNFPYPIEFFVPFQKMSKIFFQDGLFIPARFKKSKNKTSMKVRLNLSIHQDGIKSFSIDSYSNLRQSDYYDINNKKCR